MTCHLLFLYHNPYYQKSRTQMFSGEALTSSYESLRLVN
ncbi:hypothetical protein RintRC_2193 [Richelia intracellularis]|nr:hypothetical protein RintRC_2193 [Richelia intracellularis]